jgi:NADH-quinone oxidoreductase subunit G
MVAVLSAYKHGADYADVMLPIAPFSETSGTYINCEGRAQSFNGTVKPQGNARPAWKVLRVLGNLLGLSGFDYETSEAVRDEVIGGSADLSARLNNLAQAQPKAAAAGDSQLERIADVPIYFADPIVRRSPPLQQTRDAQAPQAWLSAALAKQLGVAAGAQVKVKQGSGTAVLAAAIDPALPDNVVRVAAAHAATAALGAMFGPIIVEKA